MYPDLVIILKVNRVLVMCLPCVILRALRDLDLVLYVARLVDHDRHGRSGGRSLFKLEN